MRASKASDRFKDVKSCPFLHRIVNFGLTEQSKILSDAMSATIQQVQPAWPLKGMMQVSDQIYIYIHIYIYMFCEVGRLLARS